MHQEPQNGSLTSAPASARAGGGGGGGGGVGGSTISVPRRASGGGGPAAKQAAASTAAAGSSGLVNLNPQAPATTAVVALGGLLLRAGQQSSAATDTALRDLPATDQSRGLPGLAPHLTSFSGMAAAYGSLGGGQAPAGAHGAALDMNTNAREATVGQMSQPDSMGRDFAGRGSGADTTANSPAGGGIPSSAGVADAAPPPSSSNNAKGRRQAASSAAKRRLASEGPASKPASKKGAAVSAKKAATAAHEDTGHWVMAEHGAGALASISEGIIGGPSAFPVSSVAPLASGLPHVAHQLLPSNPNTSRDLPPAAWGGTMMVVRPIRERKPNRKFLD